MRIVVTGSGRLLYFMARRILEKGHRLTLVTSDHAEALLLARQLQIPVIFGDGTDPAVLRDAEVDKADLLVALSPRDDENLVSARIALEEMGVSRALALSGDPDKESLFLALGIEPFSVTTLLVDLLEQQVRFDGGHLSPLARGRLGLLEIVLDDSSPAAGKEVHSLRLPKETLLVSVVRGEEVLVPRGDTILLSGDLLVAVALPLRIGELERALLGEI